MPHRGLGYDASVAYVESRLEASRVRRRAAGVRVRVVRSLGARADESRPDLFEYGSDFLENAFTPVVPEGTASGTLVPVDVAGADSGCEADDFTGFPAGSIALIKRGTCGFADKALNADAAGAAGVVIYNDGAAPDRFGLISMIGETPGLDIPAVFATFEVGDLLASDGPREITVTVEGEIRTTNNVLAELPGRRNNDTVIMAGAHLDSVTAGPGINDNGSGSAALLETAIQMAENRPRNTVRFAWWGAEEEGLLGSEFYVDDLSFDEQLEIELVPQLRHGRLDELRALHPRRRRLRVRSTGTDRVRPHRGPVRRLLRGSRPPTDETAFDGRSDYGPFIAVGIPAGGLFTGAEGIKTAEQAAIFGGTAGEPYDPCYHAACDTSRNVNRRVLHQNAERDCLRHTQVLEGAQPAGRPRRPTRLGLGRGVRLRHADGARPRHRTTSALTQR